MLYNTDVLLLFFHNGWKAMIYNGEEFYESKRYDINPIIDRVGGGDSFSGGIIHGLLTKPIPKPELIRLLLSFLEIRPLPAWLRLLVGG